MAQLLCRRRHWCVILSDCALILPRRAHGMSSCCTRSASTRPGPPCMRGTCSTSRPRCTTPGRPTIRLRLSTFTTKINGRRHRGCSQRGDQLRRVQFDQASFCDRAGRHRARQGGNAVDLDFQMSLVGLRPEFHVDRGQLGRRARQSSRAIGHQPSVSPTAPTKRATTRIRPASRQ